MYCYMLGNMLYLDTQKGEGGDEDRKFSKTYQRYCIVHEYNYDGCKRVCTADIK